MGRLSLLFLAAALLFAAPASEINLSATISVPQTVFHVTETEKLFVTFTVTNSGTAAVDVDTGSSQLFINGEAQKEWGMTIVNGAGASYFRPLPAGQTLQFTYQLGPRYFSKPAVYKVQWKGPHYETPEITFNVVPD